MIPTIVINYNGTADDFLRIFRPQTPPLDGQIEGEDMFVFTENNVQDLGITSDRIGFLQRTIMMTKWVQSGRKLREWMRLTTKDLLQTVNVVAAAKGVTVSAIGDGKILEAFLAFLNEHWDEILALLLKLIGL